MEQSQGIILDTFEVMEHCHLKSWEIDSIKKDIDYHINTINQGLKEGMDRSGYFISTYDRELSGMKSVCSQIGIKVRTTSLHKIKA